MSNIFHLTRNARADNRAAAGCGKLDVITAAMLTGGASGGWGMAKRLRNAARRAPCARPARTKLSSIGLHVGRVAGIAGRAQRND
jgi:hypothetical protein